MTYIGLIARYVVIGIVAFVIGVWTGRRSVMHDDDLY